MIKNIFFLQNEYIFSGYFSNEIYIVLFSVKKAFPEKKININFFFLIKLFFSANNVHFAKNTNIFSKKHFFFQLSFATNEQP